ncbi:hypothetical protein [Prochlorococcus sp. MIT 1011]
MLEPVTRDQATSVTIWENITEAFFEARRARRGTTKKVNSTSTKTYKWCK